MRVLCSKSNRCLYETKRRIEERFKFFRSLWLSHLIEPTLIVRNTLVNTTSQHNHHDLDLVIVGDRSIGTLPIDYFFGRLVVCAQCVDLCTMYRGWDVYKPLCVKTHRPSLHLHTEP